MTDTFEPVLSDGEIREMLLANGFTVKDGFLDLKPYVYQAARAIERAAIEAYVARQQDTPRMDQMLEAYKALPERLRNKVSFDLLVELRKVLVGKTQWGVDCTHEQYSFAKHGRVCPCGKVMTDFGD